MKKIIELDKAYNPKPVEEKWADFWIEKRLFSPEGPSSRKKFSMVLPPPNVTGSLHMGHALCFTLPDIIVRWRRMQGYDVLWLPGTDHASIAVHNVIEKKLALEGLEKEKVSREKFMEIAWEWKEKYGGKIAHQLKKLGFSLDWTRERFTMDEGFSRAVNKVFVDLYREGLIYRDYYLVNQCPHCNTVLSDIEIEHKELQSKLFYFKYPILDSDDHVVVATTRPETMLGDTAVAVHPEDSRFKHLHGKEVLLPLVGRTIPVITDEMVDREFGTGVVKVTPAHDPVDFDMGKRHNLEQIIVISGSGIMTEAAGKKFQGLDRFACREKVLEALKKEGVLEKTEDYQHAVGHCYRCKTVIEPHLSWQWFVKIEPLAREAIKVVEDGKIEFIPSNWTKTYYEWMYNIHDWCISRQLWWGHQIPAWYCQGCKQINVAEKKPDRCGECGSSNLYQDEDVLDTWFSSALWPFGTLGWPEKTEDLKNFYPTDLMSTGFDIIFFWVARMIMMGLKFMGDIPFKHVFINGLVRDFERQKMSKSVGNIIDPLEMIDKYGTDALRFTLAALAIPGMDISLSEERMTGYRAFVNKIWNASRFVLMNLKESEYTVKEEELTLVARWIRSRVTTITREMNESLEQYKFYEAADKIYHFVWHEFCDWYLELVKPELHAGNNTSYAVLIDMLDRILKLLHPFMPFVTEEIWQKLPGAGESLVTAAFPAEEDANRIPPRKEIDLWIKAGGIAEKQIVRENLEYIQFLAGVRSIKNMAEFPGGEKFLKGIAGDLEIGIPLTEGLVDLGKEQQRLKKELLKVETETGKIQSRLDNKNFYSRAPQEVFRKTEERLHELQDKKEKLHKNLKHINSLME